MVRAATLILVVIVAAGSSAWCQAVPPAAAHLLPPTAVLYLETDSSEQLLPTLLEHPLTGRLKTLPQYEAWQASPDQRELTQAIAFIQWQLGVPWQTAIEKLAAGGVYLAFDGATQAAAALVETDDPAFAQKTVQTFVNIARSDAAENDRADPIREVNYRSVEAFVADGLCVGVVDRWIVIATSAELAKSIVDRSLDERTNSLASLAQFAAAYQTRKPTAAVWAYADVKTIRDGGVARELFAGNAPDPGFELLLGGLLSTIGQTPYVTAELAIDSEQLQLQLATPHDPSWTPAQRAYYFGPEQTGAAPPPLRLPETVFEARGYRQLEGVFLHAPELFNEQINANLAKANSDLTTLFGGRPFAEEILGALDGGLRVVVVRQPGDVADAEATAIRLPGLAVVGRLKRPADAQRPLRIAFQTAIGFVNLNAAQQGMPPLEIETDRMPQRTILSASYWPDGESDQPAQQPMMGAQAIRMQLSPSLAFQEDAVVLASTKTLAMTLCDRLAEKAQPHPDRRLGTVHTAISVDGHALSQLVLENRQHLIGQNMLEKGHRRSEAEQEIDGLATLLSFFAGADAQLTVDVDRLELNVRLQPATVEGSP